MSALGDRLREMTGGAERYDSPVDAMADAAELADEHEAAALTLSAQGKGPHAVVFGKYLADLATDPGKGIPFDNVNDVAVVAAWIVERAEEAS